MNYYAGCDCIVNAGKQKGDWFVKCAPICATMNEGEPLPDSNWPTVDLREEDE